MNKLQLKLNTTVWKNKIISKGGSLIDIKEFGDDNYLIYYQHGLACYQITTTLWHMAEDGKGTFPHDNPTFHSKYSKKDLKEHNKRRRSKYLPGVYRFISGDQIMYVGSSKNLRSRLNHHHHAYQSGWDVEVAYTDTHSDALVLEPYLINLWRCPINDRLKGEGPSTFQLPLPKFEKSPWETKPKLS